MTLTSYLTSFFPDFVIFDKLMYFKIGISENVLVV